MMRHLVDKALLLTPVLIIVLQNAPDVIAQQSSYRLTWGGCTAGAIEGSARVYLFPSLHKHSKKHNVSRIALPIIQ